MNAGRVHLRRIESAAHLAAAIAKASTAADPYRWCVLDGATAHDPGRSCGSRGPAAGGGETGGCDCGVTWRSFAELIADQVLMDAWIRGYGQCDARHEVGGAVTALRVCAAVIDLAVGLLVVDRCAVPLPRDHVLLGLDNSRRITHVALRDAAFLIDPTMDATGERSSLSGALGSFLASELAGLLQPAFQAIRTRSRYGLRGMWGQAVDEIAAAAMRRARLLGLDQARAWRTAAEMTDALAVVQPLVRRRPSAYAASWSGGKATFAIKGTCCLYFKVGAQGDAQRYCMTCPLLAHDERAPRAASLLQRECERLSGRSQAA